MNESKCSLTVKNIYKSKQNILDPFPLVAGYIGLTKHFKTHRCPEK